MTPPTAEHLLIESRGPWSGPGCARFLGDARALAGAGHVVRVFLIQDAVGVAVADAGTGVSGPLAELLAAGAEVWVDEFSARQRAIADTDLVPGAKPAGMSAVADLLLAPTTRAVWH